MTAKQKLLLVILPVVGVAAGFAGHAVYSEKGAAKTTRQPRHDLTLREENESLRSQLAELKLLAERNAETIARLEKSAPAGTTAPVPSPARAANVLQGLLEIKQGERQLAIKGALEELAKLGNEAVPGIVAVLAEGRDQDYGGGFSTSGNTVTSYPRLRTVLIDVLRQIGTPEAHKGLLSALAGSKDVKDYRDMMMLFRTTTDETMVKGISKMVPAVLQKAREGDEAVFLMYTATAWIQRHEMQEMAEPLQEMALEGMESGKHYRGAMETLVLLSPEKAFEVVQRAQQQGSDLRRAISGASFVSGNAPLTNVTRFYELVFEHLKPDERLASTLYWSMPMRPCRKIESKQERADDAKPLVAFLEKRLAAESSDLSKRAIQGRLDSLKKEIAALEK